MVKFSKNIQVQTQPCRSSLRIYQKCIQKYKNNAIQRVKTFKETGKLVKSCKTETSFIHKNMHFKNITCEESAVNEHIQVDCVHHQALRGYSSIKELIKTKIYTAVKLRLKEYRYIKMMKCVDFILKHITFQKPTNVIRSDSRQFPRMFSWLC